MFFPEAAGFVGESRRTLIPPLGKGLQTSQKRSRSPNQHEAQVEVHINSRFFCDFGRGGS
jgi:hypothetical protein